jgi:GLPGLI family protein
MKKTIIYQTLIFILLSSYCFAQQGKIEYIFTEPENKYIYKPILQFNDSLSVFIYNRIGYDSPTKEGMSRRDDGGLQLRFASGDENGNQVYTNFKKKEIIFRRPYSKITEPYIVDDYWIEIKWKIKKQTKKIGKYTANKAIGEFRGREYTVWFTYEIPLPIGPWKLKGLPGAILEAKDKEGLFQVKFVSIKYPCDCEDEILVPNAEKKLTLKEHVYAIDNFEDILLKKIQSRLPQEIKGKLTLNKKSKEQKRKQKKEKTYEWETEALNEKKN